jgi:hypothetical protein
MSRKPSFILLAVDGSRTIRGDRMRRAGQHEVARVVREQPGRLRKASANTVLALLSAAALSPVAVEVFGGGSVVSALAGVAGNVGSGYLTDVVTNIAARLRGGKSDLADARELLATELRTALEKDDTVAGELRESLARLLNQVGGWETATDDLRRHLLTCFQELDARAAEQLRQGRRLHAEQRRHTRQLQEIVDRLRLLTQDRQAGTDPAVPPVIAAAVLPAVVPPAQRDDRWRGGAEVTVGDRVYLLQDVLLDEYTVAGAARLRQAQALRLVPSGGADRYVWLRQVQARPGVPGARAALLALERERDLLSRLDGRRVAQYTADRHNVSLALRWPASRANGPSDVLDPSDPPGLFSLFGGLAGLCDALARLHALGAAHRFVTPERIAVHDDGRLSLLDLGLAGHGYAPGEGPAGYQAPEQRRRGSARPGPHTDGYQLAAVAYHLLTGHPPHPATPLPVRGQAPGVPASAGTAIDAALNADPGRRPAIRALGSALRAARDEL